MLLLRAPLVQRLPRRRLAVLDQVPGRDLLAVLAPGQVVDGDAGEGSCGAGTTAPPETASAHAFSSEHALWDSPVWKDRGDCGALPWHHPAIAGRET